MTEFLSQPEKQPVLLHAAKIAETAEELDSGKGSYIAPRLMPESYPGDKPETTGFLVDAQTSTVSAIRWNENSSLWVNRGNFDPVVDISDSQTGSKAQPLNEYLIQNSLTAMENRYVLTAFGSNRCPGQLTHKFRKWVEDKSIDDPAAVRDMLVVPAFNGILKGYDVVYNSTLGNIGYVFGDLYAGPETKDTEIEVVTLFLTREQMQAIHESEMEYKFAEIGQVQLGSLIYDNRYGFGDFINIPAYAHIGTAEVYAERDASGVKHPVAIGDIYARNRRLVSMTQAKFQDYHFGHDSTGGKALALKLAKVLADKGVNDKEVIDSLNPDNLPEDLAVALASETLEPTGENYRKLIRWGNPEVKLAIRRAFKKWAKAATMPEERMLVDPEAASQTHIVSQEPADIPTWSHIRA
jgi:hypothetical protein